jgi:hypothetical protein
MLESRLKPLLLALALALGSSSQSWSISLELKVDNLPGGMFEYDFTLHNTATEPLGGLNLLFGNSAFGLDTTSVIAAPAGWSFFSPLPPLVDELNWFSLSPSADVLPGGLLGDFTFLSSKDPSTLKPGDLSFDAVSGISGKQVPVADGCSTLLLLFASLIGLFSAQVITCPRLVL